MRPLHDPKLYSELDTLAAIYEKVQLYTSGKQPRKYSFKRTNRSIRREGNIYVYVWTNIEGQDGKMIPDWKLLGNANTPKCTDYVTHGYHEKVDILLKAVERYLTKRHWLLADKCEQLGINKAESEEEKEIIKEEAANQIRRRYKKIFTAEKLIAQIETIIDRDMEMRKELGLV